MDDNSRMIMNMIELGMNKWEAKVYLALLTIRIAIAADLQRFSGIPRNKIYETINSLLRKKYCTEKQNGRRGLFEIVDPRVRFKRTIQDFELRLNHAKEETVRFG